jgi:hypothetical protein
VAHQTQKLPRNNERRNAVNMVDKRYIMTILI